jgi:hypothetical protein
MWELIKAAPEHVTRAPAPTIAPPPRAQVQAISDMVAGMREQVSPQANREPERRRGLFGWFRRGEESPS